jgi:predicted transport protein
MLSAVAASIEDRTGRSLQEWLALVSGSGIDPLDQNAVRRWLREVHGVRQNTQWAVADAAAQAAGWVRPSVEAYIDEQFRGAKAALRPLFDVVREAVTSLGSDVTVEGRGTYVPFVRRRQFAAVAVLSARLELGLRLPDPPASGRLQPAKAPGQSTHKIVLTTADDVNDEVRDLLRAAYDQNG